MKCNLECSYCESGLYGGRDNSTRHPALADCLSTIDFMFEYADIQMSQRISSLRHVVLNVYGGESLHHPNIVEILQAVRDRYQPYQQQWSLRVTVTTNAIVSAKKWQQIIPLIDEFTVSYHTENTPNQKQQFRENILAASAAGRPVKCVVLMHAEPELFEDAQSQINWANNNGVKVLPRQLDHRPEDTQFNYNNQQVIWFDKLYQDRNYNVETTMPQSVFEKPTTDLAAEGRACCGGRQLCVDQNYKQRTGWISNHFPGWSCSVDKFFLYVKQVNGEVFVNKDCKMNYQGAVGPIGTLDRADEILQQLRDGTPTIQCAKSRCYCGLCAPKAADPDTYQSIMRKYAIPNHHLL